MNQPNLPRSLIILLFILVVVAFIVGTLRTFAPAHATTVLENLVATKTSIASLPPHRPTPTPAATSLLPPPTDDEPPIPTPAATSTPNPAEIIEPGEYRTDMTGIIA